MKRDNVCARQHRGERIRAARLRQRKQPLNVIVVELELVEIELLDNAQRAAAVVATGTSIEGNESAVSQSDSCDAASPAKLPSLHGVERMANHHDRFIGLVGAVLPPTGQPLCE